jgi:endoglucanase
MHRRTTFPAVVVAAAAAAAITAGCLIPPSQGHLLPASGGGAAAAARTPKAPPRPGENPFAGAAFYVDHQSNASRQVENWRATRPGDASAIDKIAGQPKADWFGDWNPNIEQAVDQRVTEIARAGGLPVMVVYNVPNRDCGQYSRGGAKAPGFYKTWIRGLANGIDDRRAVVVLEPDALPLLKKCLKPADQQTRIDLVHFAVTTLKANPGTAVYMDAGHSGWIDAPEMAVRLKAAGIDEADGFALNTSNYKSTEEELRYGHELSRLLGGKHFMIDTGRNGNGAPDVQGDVEAAWCNPDGRALGTPPTNKTGDPLVDAFFWVKPPGESDGACNHGPRAGNWWPDMALRLAKAAKY